MRLHLDRDGHDPRQIDLLAIIVLLVLVFCSILYLNRSPPESVVTLSFNVPSQSVRW